MTTSDAHASQPQTFNLTISHATPSAPPAPPRRATTTQKALWLVAFALLANAGVSLYTHITGHAPDLVLDRSALAQVSPAPGGMLGARGLYMMPAQLGPNAFGLYLMDVDSQTICVYRAQTEGTSRFQLMAARTFKWDVQLEDLNNAQSPKDIQKLIEMQQKRMDLNKGAEVPTVDQHPKVDENLPDPAHGGAMAPAPPLVQTPPPPEPK